MTTSISSTRPRDAGSRGSGPQSAGAPPRGRRRLILAGVAVLAIAVLLVWLTAFSSVLGVSTVKVVGNRDVRVTSIRDAAAIRPGTPLARLDTASVAARIEALPQIRTATVTRSYPNTVVITVAERVAVGYRVSGAGFALVDKDDVIFLDSLKAPAGLPRLQPSAELDGQAVAAVAGSLPAPLAAKVASISAPTTESITLALRDGRTVLWGGTDRGEEKARVLQALLGQPGDYFDISDPGTVISRTSR